MDGVLEVMEGVEFRDEALHALYTEYPSPATLALKDGLSDEEAEALWWEAKSLLENGLASGGRMFCYEPGALEHMHPRRIKALRLIIERARPDWVERVRLACMYDNTWDGIRRLSKVPDYPALAIIRNMQERGELPPVCAE
ncbi:hypothetical protein [Rubrobacter calidifluminis]|uniref:hypothetical protein n=1 Tax=Rubrobacter calidifluminis TaxID=1392640 RepID=UPI00235F765E|nr:hypothetical protein [Rubrobacter calidifluminis]